MTTQLQSRQLIENEAWCTKAETDLANEFLSAALQGEKYPLHVLAVPLFTSSASNCQTHEHST
jgi:hypothetical protein